MSSSLPVARDDVDHAWGEASLGDEVSNEESVKRRLLGSLKHQGVAGSNGSSNVERKVHQAGVPSADGSASTGRSPFDNLTAR